MRNQSKKKKKIVWQQHVATAFCMLIGAVCGFLMMEFAANDLDTGRPLPELIFSFAALFVGMYIAIFFQMIVHEAGHLVFGLLSGYRFSSFRIFSFMWVKENGKIKLRKLSIAGTGGQCLMAPPEMVDGKFPVILYNLGGSLANTIVGAVFLVLYFAFAKVHLLANIMLLFALIGFVGAIMNGVPMRMGAVDNDGYNAFALTRNRDAMRAFWVQLKANEQISKGVRLKDMPDEWFIVPSDEAMKNSMVATMGVFACNRLMDEEKFEEAEKLMAHMLEIDSGMVGVHRNLMVCDRMYVELITQNRKDVLDGMLDKGQKKFMKQMKNFPSVLRTEYGYALLCERNTEKADKVKAQFEKRAKSYPYQNDIQSERELMTIAENRKTESHVNSSMSNPK